MQFNFLKKSAFVLTMAAALLGGCKKDDPTPPVTPTCVLTEKVDKNGDKTVYTMDASGRVSLITLLNPSGTEKRRLTYTYNPAGKMIMETGVDNGVEASRVEFIYDGDRVTRLRSYKNYSGPMVLAYNLSFTYDANGRNTSTIFYRDSTGTEIYEEDVYEYDNRGNIIKTTVYTYNNGAKALDFSTEYTYDDKRAPMATNYPSIGLFAPKVNNILTEAQKDENGEVLYTATYVYEYNSDNLPTKKTFTASVGQISEITTYSYNCK